MVAILSRPQFVKEYTGSAPEWLTYPGRNKMADIWQAIFSNACSWQKVFFYIQISALSISIETPIFRCTTLARVPTRFHLLKSPPPKTASPRQTPNPSVRAPVRIHILLFVHRMETRIPIFVALMQKIASKNTSEKSFIWLKTESCHAAKFVVIDGTEDCRYDDNLRCHQWRQNWHKYISRFSVL